MNRPSPLSISIAQSDEAILRSFPVLSELRPHLSAGAYPTLIRRMQQSGYVLVLGEVGGEVAAVAGYRVGEQLARGRFLYVDDLVTRSSCRRCGYATQLFSWLVAVAESSGCAQVHLDSGLERTEAHRFYETRGMTFASRHYLLRLP